MRRLLFILISSLFYMNCLAKEISIQLYKDNADDRIRDKRSLSVEPTATYEGNIIHIYSSIPIESFQITVKDAYNNIIYSTVATSYSEHYIFKLFDLKEGEYTLELTIGEEVFHGYLFYS
ncbi:DUF3244 domain-containing protein [Bacteroides oleiciplenus]|uniref:DUF3244 domain-containing protein n=1 Tax=Bacteroides oleiciplenus TaxID=626931 RepID=A0A3E5B1F8_9BACE|nr:DUF3244 domain-containing protein [Bacteroides oleiciplenus]RGN31390.1 DUF3244 domain-containing protein [Bacteroides oleiciplenus]